MVIEERVLVSEKYSLDELGIIEHSMDSSQMVQKNTNDNEFSKEIK